MRPLHQRLLDVARAGLGEAEPSPASPADIAAAEQRLGRPLPPGYRAFLEEVGSVCWPLSIGNVIHFDVAGAPWPAFFVPFADDGGGNYHGFDLRGRKARNLPIGYWDHEEPEIEDAPGSATRFEEWLEEHVRAAEQGALDERRGALAVRFPPSDTPRPDRGHVEEVEDLLGMALPLDYVWFTTTVGATEWPVHIADAHELLDLTARLREAWPRAPRRIAAFAAEPPGFAAFLPGGKIRSFGLARPTPDDFLAYLEDRLAGAGAPPPPHTDDDPEIDLALQLLLRLRDTGALETTRGFDPVSVARHVADAWSSPAAISDLLLARDDVIELYASPEDIAALQLKARRATS